MKNNVAKAEALGNREIVFCDFDGTITQEDVTDQILTQLAHPSWREVEQEWVRGAIGSRECLERQMALVEASAAELHALIDAIPLDPHFGAFYRFTQKRGVEFYVVSDGFDYVIRRVLKRSGVSGPLRNGKHLFASALRLEGRRLVPSFPHSAAPCAHGCATCKAEVIRRFRDGHRPVVFVGDGLSDRFALEESDVVFAKRQLLAYCREHGVTCHPFETFADVQRELEKLPETVKSKVESRKSKAGKARPAVPAFDF
jgi:2-hydroxy-3-keto-5-methylthiopentenyl-1-phosphate phosphatase